MGLDRLLDDLIHSFHASNEGKQPFNPGELKYLDELISKGYIETTIRNKDRR